MSANIPTLFVRGKNLPEAWEKAVLECWYHGVAIKTEYDKPEDPPSKDCTMMLVVEDPFAEPRIHRAFPPSRPLVSTGQARPANRDLYGGGFLIIMDSDGISRLHRQFPHEAVGMVSGVPRPGGSIRFLRCSSPGGRDSCKSARGLSSLYLE